MKQIVKVLFLLIGVAVFTGCGDCSNISNANYCIKHNSIYYWKTVFELDSADSSFLQKHDIDRIYLRMFDVATEPDLLNGTSQIVPIATTKFVSPIPNNIEIVPVAYITIDALRAMVGREIEFASLIVERLLVMSSYNECGDIKEIQLDCDWTSTTKDSYSKLCKVVKDSLSTKGVDFSITVRLHQLQEPPPPADKGVLMIYNTGALKNPETSNSILHIDDVKPYIKRTQYAIPLDYAFPVFGWGVKFENNKFASIVSYDCKEISDNENIRYERPSAGDILEVKTLVEENLGKPATGNILYHLDYSQLKYYADNEISQILLH
jgi:hypothetical protein